MKRTVCALAMLIATTVGVWAIDFDTKIVNLDGTAIVDDKGKDVTITVGTVCVNALMQPYQDEQNLAGEEKLKRMELARHVQKRDDYKFTSEDVALMKKLVNRAYPSPLVVSQAWAELEKK